MRLRLPGLRLAARPPSAASIGNEAPSATLTELCAAPHVRTAALCVLVLLVLLLAARAHLRTRWPCWFKALAARAFKAVDTDGSGSIDAEELYAGVLWLYLACNEWGLSCRAPDKALVLRMMKELDADRSERLEYAEFEHALRVFSDQILGRAGVQLTFTLLCPPAAAALVELAAAANLTPSPLATAFHFLPPSAPTVLLSSVLMLLLPFALALVDARSYERTTAARARLQADRGN